MGIIGSFVTLFTGPSAVKGGDDSPRSDGNSFPVAGRKVAQSNPPQPGMKGQVERNQLLWAVLPSPCQVLCHLPLLFSKGCLKSILRAWLCPFPPFMLLPVSKHPHTVQGLFIVISASPAMGSVCYLLHICARALHHVQDVAWQFMKCCITPKS